MDKHFTYLLINFFTIIFPLALSFDKKVAFYKKWKYLFPGLVITGLVFLLWDYVFTLYDVWSFNKEYVIGVWILNLPIEEILFFITVPFACLFIYECVNAYIKIVFFEKFAKWISAFLVLLSSTLLIAYYDKVYTLISFGLLLFMSVYILVKNEKYWGKFYLAYLISLIPFYVVNGLLTSIPVVLYNNKENMALRVGTIPFEDHFYSLSLLLMNVAFYEYFKRRGRLKYG